MMPSKTTWYAFFVALCFIISGSDGIEVVECHDDETFQIEINKCTDEKILVLITKDEYKNIGPVIINHFDNREYLYTKLIIVHADHDKCPATDKYFNTEKRYPSVSVVLEDYLYNVVYYPDPKIVLLNKLEEFLKEAESATLDKGSLLNVTQAIKDGIERQATGETVKAVEGTSKVTAEHSTTSALKSLVETPGPSLSLSTINTQNTKLKSDWGSGLNIQTDQPSSTSSSPGSDRPDTPRYSAPKVDNSLAMAMASLKLSTGPSLNLNIDAKNVNQKKDWGSDLVLLTEQTPSTGSPGPDQQDRKRRQDPSGPSRRLHQPSKYKS